jgi:threonyl-tRNA synthetase
MTEISLTFPDGSRRPVRKGITGSELASAISRSLAKKAVAMMVDGKLADLADPIAADATVKIITRTDREALELIRHDCAHVMAEAVQALWPGTQVTIGPVIENGFFYDFLLPRPLTEADLNALEARMAEIVAEDLKLEKFVEPRDVARQRCIDMNQPLKVKLIDDLPDEAEISFYQQGEFIDLCKGPHIESTGRIGAFKLMSIAGAYWRGKAENEQLTRVYGVAFQKKSHLEDYLQKLEEAKKRDHRVIGKNLKLFHIDDQVGQGMVLWTPAGAAIRQELQTFISEELRKQGYHQVFTPHIGKLDLYKTSGHFPYYAESQYPPVIDREFLEKLSDEGCSCGDLSNKLAEGAIDGYLLKPMNCPHHIKIFASERRSYRDLPLRLAEFGTVYRWEQSGELNGMTRVRAFTQDDAHLFCMEDQVPGELLGCLSLVRTIFDTLGMKDFRVRVGLRDPDSSKYVGDPANWDKAEQACRAAAQSLGVAFSEEPGEAAFYGPKIDFVVKDVIGREWQLGTVQVDYNLPIRFGLEYIGSDSQPHRPVMIHRAPFGSMERFIGVLIEHFAGAFPTWLAPEQVRFLPIADRHISFCEELKTRLVAAGVRATVDGRSEKTGKKVAEAQVEKVAYMIVVGDRDIEAGNVAVRHRDTGDSGPRPVEQFVSDLLAEISERRLARV